MKINILTEPFQNKFLLQRKTFDFPHKKTRNKNSLFVKYFLSF
ncbi:hypothetical protein HMPREF9246_0978 [Anaerococcus hydrogenalis ACS-025-V-Sch4]|uniref:Uncharacterized protein n=1 Tax=Anaerococcus hydrogenalis ACS-025-V-Sch4 TaxID=879306 RepID=F0H043_9FIRM|nr:hypothetical protein HMPREF9246_0978 [Anaerococcus hydrogenalis ACS-025-V-Sch4]